MRGNITAFQRNGCKLAAFTAANDVAANYGAIDNLKYTYNDQNQVLKIKDDLGTAFLTKGFRFANNSATSDYGYDDNGNLVFDNNKGITKITYNHLNLPIEITFTGSRKIQFIYDATGMKLRKTVIGTTIETTDYVNGLGCAVFDH